MSASSALSYRCGHACASLNVFTLTDAPLSLMRLPPLMTYTPITMANNAELFANFYLTQCCLQFHDEDKSSHVIAMCVRITYLLQLIS